jgi:hypothetical protein
MGQRQRKSSHAVNLFPNRRGKLFALLGLFLLFGACRASGTSTIREEHEGLRVQGPGVPPNLEFACCEHGVEQMQGLFAQPGLLGLLNSLDAAVAIPITDFSPQRAHVVQLLNRQGVSVVGWIVLPQEQGYYLTADNAPQAAARVADFETWTTNYGLRWTAVGLDIEPNFAELVQLRSQKWRLIKTLLGRSVNFRRISRAHKAYSILIDRIRSRGYPVQIYQMPYVPAERSVHSTLPDRLLGTVDVRGDQDYLMLYTSYARPVGAGMIWSLGPHAWGIGIGSTDGKPDAATGSGPLDWNEFSRDLIVASHFTRQIGVYDLEGCVRQGFLPRLLAMDWGQTVVIPRDSAQRAARVGFVARSILWIVSNLIYLVSAAFLLIGWLLWHRRAHRKSTTDSARHHKASLSSEDRSNLS